MSRPLAVVVLAAGLGKRTKIGTPKVLLPLCGRTLLATILDEVAQLAPVQTVVVVHHGREQVERAVAGHPGVRCVDQGSPRGTGHAVQQALAQLEGFDGDLMVLNGDGPLITAASLRDLREARGDAPAALLTALVEEPTGLGRVLRDPEQEENLRAIREEADCTDDERLVDEINAGFYCFDLAALRPALASLDDRNAQRELYLTAAVDHFVQAGQPVRGLLLEDAREALGVNSLADLALVRQVMQERILLRHLAAGVVIEDPATTFIDWDVAIGPETRILPCTVLRSGVRIGRGCEVGPFAHLRAGTQLADGAEIGNFVEAKNAQVGAHTKAKHLTYLGDTSIGERANIGAGTITANYDGKHKHRTEIGDGAFIGSGTVLVAPVQVGARATTGAGAIVTRRSEIGPGEVWVGVPARKLQRPSGGNA